MQCFCESGELVDCEGTRLLPPPIAIPYANACRLSQKSLLATKHKSQATLARRARKLFTLATRRAQHASQHGGVSTPCAAGFTTIHDAL